MNVPEEFQNEDGEIDRPQLMDDLEQYLDSEDDAEMLLGMSAELNRRAVGGVE